MMAHVKRGFGWLWATALLLWVGCGTAADQNHLIGKWKVFHVTRGGDEIGGPSFKGTEYTFRENGTVFGQNANGDTLTSRYRQSKDSLVYIAIPSLMEEPYHLDSLTPDRLIISATIDGIPTIVRMLRPKK